MTSREQDNVIERMTEAHGRVLVRHGYADGSARLTLACGKHYVLSEAGTLRPSSSWR